MKLTKLLILALGLMVLCAATSFGQAGGFSAAVGYREVANNGQTIET